MIAETLMSRFCLAEPARTIPVAATALRSATSDAVEATANAVLADTRSMAALVYFGVVLIVRFVVAETYLGPGFV